MDTRPKEWVDVLMCKKDVHTTRRLATKNVGVGWMSVVCDEFILSHTLPPPLPLASLPTSATAPSPSFTSSTVTCSSADILNSTPLQLNDWPFCSNRPPSTPVLSAFLMALALSTSNSRLRNFTMACRDEPVGSASWRTACSILSKTVLGAPGTLEDDLGGMV